MALGLGTEFPIISSNLGAGYGVFGTADPYNAALPNNGALNPLGSIYFIPAPSEGGLVLSSVAGYAMGLWIKYVLYLGTGTPAMRTGPAPVYYTTAAGFSTVSGAFADGMQASKSISCAGWLLVNTGAVAGVGVGSAVSTTILQNGGLGSYVFIDLCGFIPSAYLAAGAASNRVYGSGDFATTGVAIDGSAYSDYWFIGNVMGAVNSNIANVVATLPIF